MKIIPSSQDILHTLKQGQRLDNLAYKYYGDANLSWVIMCANVDYTNEFEIKFGTTIRIPFPLSRIFSSWQIENVI
jgi:nucleoid-associated protein YgaU